MNEQAFSIKIEKSPLETIRYEGKGTAAHAKSIFKKLLRISNVRVRCKVNRKGQPVDGFNVEKGNFRL